MAFLKCVFAHPFNQTNPATQLYSEITNNHVGQTSPLTYHKDDGDAEGLTIGFVAIVTKKALTKVTTESINGIGVA